jgi:peroxiredoxin
MFQKIIFVFIVSLFLAKQNSFAQENEKIIAQADSLNEADSLPNFTFFTIKDSVEFTPKKLKKGLPVLFISFNTECDHCQKETEALKDYMDYFSGIQIIMVSRQSRAEILKFYKQNNIKEYPIIMLQDPTNQLHKLFDFVYIPMIRQYNKNWKRIAAYNEQAPVGAILKNFDEAEKK